MGVAKVFSVSGSFVYSIRCLAGTSRPFRAVSLEELIPYIIAKKMTQILNSIKG
jgi:hypothetical protein